MTSARHSNFTRFGYIELIDALVYLGYAVRSFVDAQATLRHLILRHDIDISLEAAAQMAALEAQHGLRATYFVLVRSEFYNPASMTSRAALHAIRDAGHTIGLHFDAALHPPESIDEAASAECTLLERIVEASVETISFHRPPAAEIGGRERIGGRLNVYAHRFVREMGYCSDSRGAWHHGHPLDHPAVSERRALHLLTHPIWWMGEGDTPTAKLKRFLTRRFAQLDRELARHCAVHIPASADE